MFGYMSKKDRRIKNLEVMVKNRDKLIDRQENLMSEQQKLNRLLLNRQWELMYKIADLENNIEFLVNNLSAQKRKQLGL